MANGETDPQSVIDRILSGELPPTDSGLALLEVVKDMAPGTKSQYLTMLGGKGKKGKGAGFLKSVLGKDKFDTEDFADTVPTGDNYTLKEKKQPTVEELKHILRSLANPRDRALVGVMSLTGMRIGETVSRRMSDLERRPDGHAKLSLEARSTKKRYVRYAFLTKEVVDWIDAFRKNGLKDSPWIFPGEVHGDTGAENKHLGKLAAERAIKELFIRCGCRDSENFIYSSHSFRGFSENQMIRAGMGDKFVRLITGHSGKTERAYKDWDIIESEWVEKCSEKMTWLTETIVVTKPDPEQERKIKELENKFGKLTEALRHLLLGEGVHESAEDIRKLLGWDKEQQEYKIVLKDGRRVSKAELEAYLKARERKELPDDSEVTDTGTKVGSGA